jgi:hypothetical protein
VTSDFGLYEPSTEDRGRVRICGRAQLDGLQRRGRSNEAAAPNARSLRDEQRGIWRCAREGESRENVKFQSRRRGWYVKRKRGRCRCTGGAEREDNVGIRYGSIKDLKDKREGVGKCLCGGGWRALPPPLRRQLLQLRGTRHRLLQKWKKERRA